MEERGLHSTDNSFGAIKKAEIGVVDVPEKSLGFD